MCLLEMACCGDRVESIRQMIREQKVKRLWEDPWGWSSEKEVVKADYHLLRYTYHHPLWMCHLDQSVTFLQEGWLQNLPAERIHGRSFLQPLQKREQLTAAGHNCLAKIEIIWSNLSTWLWPSKVEYYSGANLLQF